MRIAFHVPRGSYLKQSRVPSGDVTNVRNLVAGLTRLGHQVSVVSHLHVRRLWRGRVNSDQPDAGLCQPARQQTTLTP